MTNQCAQVKLELGHKASVRKKPTPEGFTHDWTVFVRGPEGSNIQHFVDKVIFYLHESFPKPKRVVKEPPYQVSESGYAGFLLPIEVYFKNKEEPKKVCFDYDLFLHLEGCPPVNHICCEKLTFQNPTEDFRRKLVKAGGVPIPPNEVPTYPPPVSGSTETQSFVDVFGTPHKSSKSSPEPSKKFKSAKDWKSGTSKGPKSTLSTTSSSTVPSKEPKSSSKDKEHRTSTREMKTAIKRPPSPTSVPLEVSNQKSLKRSLSTSSSTSISNDSFAAAQAKKDKKNKDKDKHKKERSHKDKKQESDSRKNDSETMKPHKKSTPLPSTHSSVTVKTDSASSLTGPTRSELLLLENMRSDDEMQERDNQDPADTSPSSSISFSSLPVVGVGGALGTLMAELDDQDDEDDFISPIPSEKSPPNLLPMNSTKPLEVSKPPETQSQPLKTVTNEKQEKKPEKKHKRTSSNSSKKSSKSDKKSISNSENNPNGQNQNINNEYIAELLDLQRRIMALKDRHHLQQIVNVIEETGLFQVTNTTFDFDLCCLDKNTVRKLQGCLQATT